MKKVFALMLVLGLTSLAGASLIFTIDGVPQEPEITLFVSEEVVLDLHLDVGENIKTYQLMYTLSNEQAEFILPDPETAPQYGISFPWVSDAPGKVNAFDGDGVMSWVEIAAGNFFAATAGPLTLMDGLILHCLDDTPVTLTVVTSAVSIIDGVEIPIDTVMHTLDIIQIPEPMTIVLLGLGGLLLRRRR